MTSHIGGKVFYRSTPPSPSHLLLLCPPPLSTLCPLPLASFHRFPCLSFSPSLSLPPSLSLSIPLSPFLSPSPSNPVSLSLSMEKRPHHYQPGQATPGDMASNERKIHSAPSPCLNLSILSLSPPPRLPLFFN